MSMPTPDFWWSAVTGPQAFAKAVAGVLLEGRMALAAVPDDLPWRQSMRSEILARIREGSASSDTYIETVDAQEDCPDPATIGTFLLERFGSRQVAGSWRPRSGKSIQRYLADNRVLAGKILWIKGIAPGQAPAWTAFCRGFGRPSPETGLFVVECAESVPDDARSCFAVVDFARYVSGFDVQMLAALGLARQEQPLPKLWQRYAAATAAQLAGFDAELAEALLDPECTASAACWRSQDPLDMLARIADWPAFARRGRGPGSRHALAHLRLGRPDELAKRVWTAQIQVLFPIIEMQRTRLVDHLRPQLEEALDRLRVEQFGARLDSPDELEFGTLVYLLALRTPEGEREVYVPDEALRETVHSLRDARNLLAHRHQRCTPAQIDFILERESRALGLDWTPLQPSQQGAAS